MPEFRMVESPEIEVRPIAATAAPPDEDTAPDDRGDQLGDGGGLITEAFVDGIVRAAFDALAAARGPHWALSDQEASNLIPPLTRELQRLPFLRDVPGDSDLGLVVVHGAIILTTRLLIDANLRRSARQWSASERADSTEASASRPADGGGPVQVIHRSEIYGAESER